MLMSSPPPFPPQSRTSPPFLFAASTPISFPPVHLFLTFQHYERFLRHCPLLSVRPTVPALGLRPWDSFFLSLFRNVRLCVQLFRFFSCKRFDSFSFPQKRLSRRRPLLFFYAVHAKCDEDFLLIPIRVLTPRHFKPLSPFYKFLSLSFLIRCSQQD